MRGRSVTGTPVAASEGDAVGCRAGPRVDRGVARGAGGGVAVGRGVAAGGPPTTISDGTLSALAIAALGPAGVVAGRAVPPAPADVHAASRSTSRSAASATTVEERREFVGVICG
jgi:hypothetical protein